MRKISLLLFFSAVLFAGYLSVNSQFGDIYTSTDVRAFSMGGITVFSLSNPALSEGTFIVIKGGLNIPSESRSRRVFDTYDNTVGKMVISSGTYFLPGVYGVNAQLNKGKFSFGFDFHPYVYTTYRYNREIRNEYYVVTGEEEERYEFNLSGYNPYIGFKLGYFSLGLGFRVLNGYTHNYDRVDTVSTEIWKRWKGYNYNAGLIFTPSKRFSMGILYNANFSLSTGEGDTLYYPPVFATGVRYSPPNLLPSVVMAEVEYVPWSQSQINGSNTNYQDLLRYRFGVQHRLTSGLYMRLGFNYSGSLIAETIARGTFTAGLGWEKGKNKASLSFVFSNINYKGDEINLTGETGNLYFSETESDILIQIRRDL